MKHSVRHVPCVAVICTHTCKAMGGLYPWVLRFLLVFPPSLSTSLSAGSCPEVGSRSQPCAICCCVLCLNPLASAGTAAALSSGDLNLQGDICMSRAQIITYLPDITCCLKAGTHRVRGTKGMELPDALITSLNTVMRTNPSSE